MNKNNFFVERSKKIHGDKYDYSKVEYKNTDTKVCIICPEHGEFWQTPHNHLHGQGCKKCATFLTHLTQKSTNAKFVDKAKQIHGNKYDYSKVEYINNKTKVCIICPEHGEFWQTPNSHLNGCECKKCADERNGKKKSLTLEQFIKRSKKIHGDKYDYSKVKYKNIGTKVCIICPEHGEFWQTPDAHLSGQGCPICGSINRIKHIKKTKGCNKTSFVIKSRKVHGDKYDYSKVEYINANTKVCIVCPEHGEFWQTPSSHLKGNGCRKCVESSLERAVRIELEKNNIKYVQGCGKDYFIWLKRQHLDFYLPDYNVAIECQGEQHFKSVKHFGGIEKFRIREKRDKNKIKLCSQHKIKLIYYSKLNVDEINDVKNYNNEKLLIERIISITP